MDNLKAIDSLAMRARSGDRKAANELSTIMHPIAIKVANSYTRKVRLGDTFVDDYISEAMIGMLGCIDSFDSEKGSFVYYARYAMAQAVRDFITYKQRLISQPKNVTEKIAKFVKAQSRNKDGVDADISRESGLSKEALDKAREYYNREYIVSLDGVSEEEDFYLIDKLESPENVEDTALMNIGINAIEDTIMDIDEADRVILFSYFGAFGYEKLSVKTIASQLGISPQMVIYRRSKTIKKIRELAIA